MKLIVIDNEPNEVISITHTLERAFHDAIVLPEKAERGRQQFKDWSRVQTYIDRITDDDAVLFLDLSLGQPDSSDVIRGLRNAHFYRILKPGWTFVAFTKHGARIMREPLYLATFDGLLDKGTLDGVELDKATQFVKRHVQHAVNKRSSKTTGSSISDKLRIVDSLGMRLFRAAFGDLALSEIIEEQAADWKNITVESLTSGHSGAFMLGITGANSEALVLKVAQEETVITDEIHAQEVFMHSLSPFAGYLCPLTDKKFELHDSKGAYYRQARVEGTSLIDLLHRRSPLAQAGLDHLLGVYARVYAAEDESVLREISAGKMIRLTAIDRGRIEKSIDFLVQIGNGLLTRGFWPPSSPDPTVLGEMVRTASQVWNSCIEKVVVKAVVHPRDLNPGNVIVRPDGSPVFVDLARLGLWHVGYDLSRLLVMLRLRLIGDERVDDWYPDSFKTWVENGILNVISGETHGIDLCPEATKCADALRRSTQAFPVEQQDAIQRGYYLGVLWDSFKILSYQDTSVFKRAWMLLESALLIRHVDDRWHLGLVG